MPRLLLRAACYLLMMTCFATVLSWPALTGSMTSLRHWGRDTRTQIQARYNYSEISSNPSGNASSGGSDSGWDLAGRLRQCTSFACLREQQAAAGPGVKFNFPHFIVVGWQKSATTALNGHLKTHPQALAPSKKEPHFFSEKCSEGECPPEIEQAYITDLLHLAAVADSGMQLAAYEASADYAKNAQRVAPLIRAQVPWVKIVASIREPITHAMSVMNHHRQEPNNRRLVPGSAPPCLQDSDAYTCLKRYYTEDSVNNGYTRALTAWVQAFPPSQLFFTQYENLTHPDSMPHVLDDFKRFLGLDPSLPQEKALKEVNVRQKSDGWPIERQQYQEIVDLVRPDAESVAELLASRGLGGGRPWLALWEQVWQRNLEACDTAPCKIRVD